jgi:hypothetical protein
MHVLCYNPLAPCWLVSVCSGLYPAGAGPNDGLLAKQCHEDIVDATTMALEFDPFDLKVSF